MKLETHKTSSTDYTSTVANIYSNRKNKDTGFIAYRDLPELFKELYKDGHDRALDFGCGTGFSSNLLYEAGFNVLGVDVNENMLSQAINRYPNIEFIKMVHDQAFDDGKQFDLILCAFVLLEIPSLDGMIKLLKNLNSYLKNDGHLVIVTTSENFPKHDWKTAKNNLSENKNILSGQNYQVLDTVNNMVFSDFYYDDQSYRKAILEAGLNVKEFYQPLGKKSDNIEWTTEWDIAPYSIYICSHAR